MSVKFTTEKNRMRLTAKTKVTQKDIDLGVEGEGESCPIARALKRDGFTDVDVLGGTVTCTKYGVVWKYNGATHDNFVEKFDDDRDSVKPREFSFHFDPVKVVEKDEANTETDF